MTDLAQDLVQALARRAATVTFAESCTGGLIASTLTEVAGASAVFRASYVLYCDEEKERLLGVPASVIQEHGAVSQDCVLELLKGLARGHGPCYAAAVSGIAGPSGARPGKPVGTVCIGLASPENRFSKRFEFQGDRRSVRTQAVEAALRGLLRLVKEEEAPW